MRDERRLNQRRFNQFLEDRAGNFKVFVIFCDFNAVVLCPLTTFIWRKFKPICTGFFADKVFVFRTVPIRREVK